MKISRCKEKQKLIISFCKTSFKDLTDEQKSLIVEHTEKCSICTSNEEILYKEVQQLHRKKESMTKLRNELDKIDRIVADLGLDPSPSGATIKERVTYVFEQAQLLGIDIIGMAI